MVNLEKVATSIKRVVPVWGSRYKSPERLSFQFRVPGFQFRDKEELAKGFRVSSSGFRVKEELDFG